MPRISLEYPKEGYSTVKRYNHIASYSLETIHGIINASPVVHVAFHDPASPFPAILPMIGQMGSFARPSAGLGDVLDLYVHGYVSARVMNAARAEKGDGGEAKEDNEKKEKRAEGEETKEDKRAEGEDKKGLPVSVSASLVDGLVLALTPYAHNYNFRSAVVFGYADVVTDPAEKLWAMELVTDSVVPGRWTHSRTPPTSAELQSTSILRVRIHSGSAKIHTGGPEDKGESTETHEQVWAGTVPMYKVLGEPVPAAYNNVAQVPEHIATYCKDFNDASKEYAVEAIQVPVVKKKTGWDDEE